MIVYLITNIINQKRYVGITTRSLKERFEQHCNYAESYKTKKSALRKAIEKYGRDNFIIKQIDTANNINELYEKEKYWINKLGTFSKEYNLTLGGDGTHGRIVSEETKDKIRNKTLKQMQSIEHRKNISEKLKLFYKQHPEEKEKRRIAQLGVVPTDETRRKISESKKGKPVNRTLEGKQRIILAQKTRIREPISEKCKIINRQRWLSNNPMNDPEKRRLVSLSKIGKKRFYRSDGSYYLSYPENPKDPNIKD